MEVVSQVDADVDMQVELLRRWRQESDTLGKVETAEGVVDPMARALDKWLGFEAASTDSELADGIDEEEEEYGTWLEDFELDAGEETRLLHCAPAPGSPEKEDGEGEEEEEEAAHLDAALAPPSDQLSEADPAGAAPHYEETSLRRKSVGSSLPGGARGGAAWLQRFNGELWGSARVSGPVMGHLSRRGQFPWIDGGVAEGSAQANAGNDHFCEACQVTIKGGLGVLSRAAVHNSSKKHQVQPFLPSQVNCWSGRCRFVAGGYRTWSTPGTDLTGPFDPNGSVCRDGLYGCVLCCARLREKSNLYPHGSTTHSEV